MTSEKFLSRPAVLPLLVASGAGSESRQAIGTTVFGGMLVATVVSVIVVPMPVAPMVRSTARERLPVLEVFVQSRLFSPVAAHFAEVERVALCPWPLV